VEYGAHLPLIDFEGARPTLADLRAYAGRAAVLGYRFLGVNDHLVFSRPWLDGPVALAATIDAAADLTIATTVSLPVVRGPVQTAKTLAALDVLSGGRLLAGVGPGSSPRDYAAAGIEFQERWGRFDEAIRVLRLLLGRDVEDLTGTFYATNGLALQPRPLRRDGLPIWIASWGSPAGLHRVARLGDGWLASGYNTTPARFRDSLARLATQLRAAGKDPQAFPNAIVTMWLYVTETPRDADRILADVLAPLVGRSVEALRDLALPIGSAEQCAERISAYADAGAQRVFVWPLTDQLRQLELFRERASSRSCTPNESMLGQSGTSKRCDRPTYLPDSYWRAGGLSLPQSEHPTTSNTPGHRPHDPATRPSRQSPPRWLHRAPARRTGTAQSLSRCPGMATLCASETFKTSSIRSGYNWSMDALRKDFR
jgi:alkanesulfonate monooxygenase SsuD/methylene tetrahydromethanopterin reductase-like flavin-dependent oxidoreductase (luciferase family)